MPARTACIGFAVLLAAGMHVRAQGPILEPVPQVTAPQQYAAPPEADYPQPQTAQEPVAASRPGSWLSLPGIWVMNFAHNVATDFHRNNCWPEPFMRSDRMAARAPMMLMIANGWQRQNTLSEHHFVDSGEELNESGQLKVRWILVHAPVQHRRIFVLAAPQHETTLARVAAVEGYLNQVARDDPPPVLVTQVGPLGWPASRVDVINRKWDETVPAPRLPVSDGRAEATTTNN